MPMSPFSRGSSGWRRSLCFGAVAVVLIMYVPLMYTMTFVTKSNDEVPDKKILRDSRDELKELSHKYLALKATLESTVTSAKEKEVKFVEETNSLNARINSLRTELNMYSKSLDDAKTERASQESRNAAVHMELQEQIQMLQAMKAKVGAMNMPTPIPTKAPPSNLVVPTEACLKLAETLDDTPDPFVFTVLESSHGGNATVLDLAAGTAVLYVGLSSKVQNCLTFASSPPDYDPYIEMHKLRTAQRTNACDTQLNASLAKAFGPATFPNMDVWHLSYTQARFTKYKPFGPMMMITLRPRRETSQIAPFLADFKLPNDCIKGMDLKNKTFMESKFGTTSTRLENMTSLFFNTPVQAVELSLDDEHHITVKLAGDLLEGLHDGVLADGGRFGQLVLSHDAVWNWEDFSTFQTELRDLIQLTFGVADAEQSDSIMKGWDAHTVNFLLAPRAIARNMNGRTIVKFSPIPSRMINLAPDSKASIVGSAAVVDNIAIEDVVTAYADVHVHFNEDEPAVSFNKHPVVEYSTFLKGGFTLAIVLQAGAFFIEDSSEVEVRVKAMIEEVYGEPLADSPDVVKKISPEQAEITLGKRAVTENFYPKWTNTEKAPPLAGQVTAKPSSLEQERLENHAYPDSHRVLRLTLPASIIVSPGANVTGKCLAPSDQSCTYIAYTGPVIHPFPSLVIKMKEILKYKWAVIGAGPSGMNGLGRVLDSNRGREDSLLWIDERGFSVGRLEGYHDVQSMNPCQDFISYMNDYTYYSTLDYGDSRNPLLTYESNKRHCRLGFLSEPLLKATRVIRSALTSITGRVTDMHKVFFEADPNRNVTGTNTTDFLWSLRVDGGDPIWVTQGVVVAIGADHHHETFTKETPPEIPFTTSLNPGLMRKFIEGHEKKLGEAPGRGIVVAVFGAGPSGVVALHNLALLNQVTSVIHYVRHLNGDFVNVLPVRHDGKFLNVTRVVVCS